MEHDLTMEGGIVLSREHLREHLACTLSTTLLPLNCSNF